MSRRKLVEEVDIKNTMGEVVRLKVADISHVDAKDWQGSHELWVTTNDGQLLIFQCSSSDSCHKAVESIGRAIAEYWASWIGTGNS